MTQLQPHSRVQERIRQRSAATRAAYLKDISDAPIARL